MISDYRQRVNHLIAKRDSVVQTLRANTRKHRAAVQTTKDSKSAIFVAQKITQLVQKRVYKNVANMVTYCLEFVFGQQYEFHLDFEKRRNKTEAVLYFTKGGHKVDPLFDTGGGIVDVAAFACQLSCLFLHKPNLLKFLALDEPFKYVSVKYRENLRNLLQSLSRDMDVQFLIVTHIEELCMGKIIRMENEGESNNENK